MERPASVTVFGILNIVFAALGFFALLASAMMLFSAGAMRNPVMEQMRAIPQYDFWLKLTIPLGILSSIVLLVAGIGLLRLRSWGRLLSILYGWYAIIFGVVGIGWNYLFLMRPMMEQARQQGGPEAMGAMGGAIGGTVGGCLGLIYPVLLLIFMTRPRVKAAFQARETPGFPTGT
jgi:hypothetical protein